MDSMDSKENCPILLGCGRTACLQPNVSDCNRQGRLCEASYAVLLRPILPGIPRKMRFSVEAYCPLLSKRAAARTAKFEGARLSLPSSFRVRLRLVLGRRDFL
jgi:hypothetical protein